jgi:hypothetical protein
VKGAIMFARDQYYSKAKSSLGGAFVDIAKGFITDGVLGALSGGWWFGVKAVTVGYDLYEGKGKVQGAYSDITAFKNVPVVPNGPAKTAATALISFSYGQKTFKPKSKNQAASDALGYILGTEVGAYRAKEFAYQTREGAINRVAAWISI